MTPVLRRAGWLMVLMGMLCASRLDAQQWRQPPQIGYAWPAGARQGETLEITVGGQYLDKATQVLISGQGVQGTLTDYTRPLNSKELGELRDLFQQAQQKTREEGAAGKPAGPLALHKNLLEMAKEKGITEKQIEAFKKYRDQRADTRRQLNPQLAESVTVRVALATDAKPGIRELRILTPNGLSNPVRFVVGQLPEHSESEPNDKPSQATTVPALPMLLNGQIMPGDVDCFRFQARRGQKLGVWVSAWDLVPYLADAVPGWFQATVALYDADGREVAYADDYRFNPDPVLVFDVPRDGDYVLEIRDSIYRGREDFVYRVALGELPFVSSVFPLGGRRGERVAVSVSGHNLPSARSTVDLSADELGLRTFEMAGTPCVSNVLPFAVNDLPEATEAEPNGDARSAGRLNLPVIVNGRIDKSGDWDVFRFHADKGTPLAAEVQARRLGSPLDSIIRLTNIKGRELASNDDCVDKGSGMLTHHADSHLLFTVPETADYLLWIGDAQGRGGDTYGYRLRLSLAQPDFELRVTPSAVNVQGGSTVPITVYALRRDGFSGDITLKLKDAPKGCELSGAWIPAGQDCVQVVLQIPPAEEQHLTHFQLEGTASLDGRELHRTAVPADNMMQAFIYEHLVPAQDWTFAIGPQRWSRPTPTAAGPLPVKLNPKGTTEIRLQVPRRFQTAQVRLELNSPPPGITIQGLTPLEDALVLTLQVDPGKAKPGLKGNLILNSFMESQTKADQGPVRTLRMPAGVLPAIPFEVVAP